MSKIVDEIMLQPIQLRCFLGIYKYHQYTHKNYTNKN